MAQEVLIYLSVIISVAAVLAILARAIKQPPIIAYLIAGVIAGPLVLNLVGAQTPSAEIMQTFARIGVAFLLFIVGLSLDFRLLKEIGKVSSISGLVEMIIVGFIGFWASIWLGFSNIAAFYIGAAIAFSSTVVVVKILSDKKEMDTLHGKITLGILIVQDIVASICLMLIPFFGSGGNIMLIFKELAIAIALIMLIFLAAVFIFNRFLNYLARSQEALFIFGIAWALVIATIFYLIGFSIEIGALIAGISLASSKYALDLSGKMKPLRDFFIVLFFVFFGSQLSGPLTMSIWKNVAILSLLVMIIKPLVVMVSLKFFGYTKRTNFLASLSLAQVSEFSLILVLLGFTSGHLGGDVMNTIVLVSLLTIGASAYTISISDKLSHRLSGLLSFFDGKLSKEEQRKNDSYDIILFGYHRMGYKLLETIRKTGKSFAVIDYNPKVVLGLIKRKTDCLYGDAGNKHFLSDIKFENAKLVISTIPDESTNITILEMLKEKNSKAAFIATAEQPRTALDLYNLGVDYVLIPHHLGGDYAAHLVRNLGVSKKDYREIGKEHRHHLNRAKRSSIFD